MNYRKDDSHDSIKYVMRLVGGIALVVGAIFTVIGAISFFGAFGSHNPPQYFWCAFVGLPLVSLGLWFLKAGFLGRVAKYASDEITPVVGDAAKHIASSIKTANKDESDAHGKLITLNKLLADNLITKNEYDQKRKEIIGEL